MPRAITVTKVVHALAGTIALLTIFVFWISTAVTELFASSSTIAELKMVIPWGFLWLVPALAITGGSGLQMAKGRRSRIIASKKRRMPIVAGVRLLILIPAALFLSVKAHSGAFDAAFYAVQAIELIAGASNILLLAASLKDGLKISGRFQRFVKQDGASPG